MEKLSDETLLTLLEDTDTRSSLAAMQFMLKRGDLDAFVAAHQDEENPRLRRRIQQLHNVARLRRRREEFIEALDARSMTFWQAVRSLSLIFDQRYSEMALDEKIDEFLKASRMRHPSSEALTRLLVKKNFEPPRYNEMFQLETFFLPEALFNYHTSVARGGIGMTTVAYASVSRSGLSFAGQLWLREEIVPELKKLTDAIHAEGAKASI